MKQRVNSSLLEMVRQKKGKNRKADILTKYSSWGNISRCFLVVVCGGGKSGAVLVVMVVMMMVLMRLLFFGDDDVVW